MTLPRFPIRGVFGTAVIRVTQVGSWFAVANCLFNAGTFIGIVQREGIVVAPCNFLLFNHETCHWMHRVIATIRLDRGFRGFTILLK